MIEDIGFSHKKKSRIVIIIEEERIMYMILCIISYDKL